MGRLSKEVKHKRKVLHQMIDEGRLDRCLGLCYAKDKTMKFDNELLMIVLTAIHMDATLPELSDIEKPIGKKDFQTTQTFSIDVDDIRRFTF